MQTANAMVRLGGDKDNIVPVYKVTASEIAVLRVIHGEDSIYDVEPVGEVKLSHREERMRLIDKYGRPRPDGMSGEKESKAVTALFPGVAARVFERLDELELPDHMIKPPPVVAFPTEAAEPKKATKRLVKPAEPVAEAAATEDTEEDDGIGEMPGRVFA